MFVANYLFLIRKILGTGNNLSIQRSAQRKPRVSACPWHLRLQRKSYKTVRLSRVCESACPKYLQRVRNCSRRVVATKSKRVGARMRPEETIVHIVSNDPVGTKRLTEFFLSKGLNVTRFRTAAEYIAAQRDDRPACLILDLILPDLSGLEIQSRLVGSGAPPIIFVTAHGDPISVVRAMKNGAIDFLIKPIDYNQLMAAVEIAFVEDLNKRKEIVERKSLLVRWQSLTPRETEVFHHTVAGLLNKQAASELGVAENTYQVHRGRVMRKMKADSLADLVRMSTKLEPILQKPREEDSASRKLAGEATSMKTARDRTYRLPQIGGTQAVAVRAY
jgi:FixJ family two-component response regulator